MSEPVGEIRVGYTPPKPTTREVGKLRFKPAPVPGKILGKSSVMAKRSVLVLVHHQQVDGSIPPTKDACELMGVASDILQEQRHIWLGGIETDTMADLIWATSVFTSYIKEVMSAIAQEGSSSLFATKALISSAGKENWEERAMSYISEKMKLIEGLKCDTVPELLVLAKDFVKMSLTQDHKLWPVIIVSKKTPWRSKFYSLMQEKGDPNHCMEVLKRFEAEKVFEIDMHEAKHEVDPTALSGAFDYCVGQCGLSHKCPVEKILGKGSYGLVYEGHFSGNLCAVKSWRHSTDEDEPSLFLAELDLLTKLKHPNVIRLIGATISPPNYCIVMQNCERGDLHSLVHDPEMFKTLSPSKLLDLCYQAAKGLSYLHGICIIHRDVKPSNYLVTQGWDVKLTDFSISGFIPKTEALRANYPFGTPLYMSPEVYKCELYSFSADVFSFGITINEIISGEEPYCANATESGWEAILEQVTRGLRPTIHESNPESVSALIRSCLLHEAEKRPDMAQVAQELHTQSQISRE